MLKELEETSDPGASPAGGVPLAGRLRGLRTVRVSGRGSASLDATQGASAPRSTTASRGVGCVRSRRRIRGGGYKMAARVVRREGRKVNRKRVQRLWRGEGLKRPPQGRKRRRVQLDTAERLRARHPNHVWAIAF